MGDAEGFARHAFEEVAFDAGSHGQSALVVDAAYVDARLKDLSQSEDLARYVL